MPKGGARNRSGPPPKEDSGRSDARGYSLQSLPATGYRGRIPRFPLGRRRVLQWVFEDKSKYQVLDTEMTELVAERERELWIWAWRTPQAWAWSQPSEQWRIMSVAMWVRTFVICESNEGTAADKNSLHRFADQIGLTTAGLAEMGWKVAADDASAAPAAQATARPARRLRAVPDAG